MAWSGGPAVVVERQGFGENDAMNERTGAQPRVIRVGIRGLGAVDTSAWLVGGWGLDPRIGRIAHEQSDIEFWLKRELDRPEAV